MKRREQKGLVVLPDDLVLGDFQNEVNNKKGEWMAHSNFPFQVVFDNRTT